MGDTEGYATWFGSALRSSEQYKFAAHVGIAMAAGAAAYFTGGASLALMGGQKAAAGAHIASMLVGGAGMTVTSRGLNTAIFHHPFLAPGTLMDKAVDFGGEVLHNTALMGVLKLGNIAGASLPIMDGEPVIAAAVNASRNFAIEFGSFTGFNMISSVSHVIDDRYPSMDDALSKDALLQNAAFILGLRVGHAGLNAAKFATARAATAVFSPTHSYFGEVAPFPLFIAGRVIPIMSALYLMDGKVPPAILSTQLLGLRPTNARNAMLIQLMGRMGASRPMALLRAAINILGGIHAFEKETINRIEDATDFASIVMSHLNRAIADQQAVGFEFEFDPKTTTRDQTHIMMAQALKGAGYTVDIQNGAQDFTFMTPLKVAPIIVGRGFVKGQPVLTEIFQNNGTVLVSVVRDADTAETRVLTANQATSLADADKHLNAILDAPPKEKYLIIAKDDSGDTLKMAVEITGRTQARLTGINGKFYGADGQVQDSVDINFGTQLRAAYGTSRPELAAVLAYVKQVLPQELTIQKTNRITQLKVDGLGNGIFQVVDEVPPFLEAITAKMNVGEVGNTKPMIAAFSNSGFDGTRAAKMVGMHVHAEVSHQLDGHTSIAPALSVLRAFAASNQYIYDLFPSHKNRGGFIQRMSDTYQKLLADPNYVTDPTDPTQITRVIADYNRHMPVKYSDLNMDNIFAVIVNKLGLDPALARTAPNKPTAELRLFDSIMDPNSVTFIAQFWGAFVHKYANNLPQ
jgi:hypothetical protein